jgi:ABC-type Fe3+/spermidine/putrescine transport system ATPase subunit
MTSPILELQNVHKRFDERRVLHGVTLDLHPNEVVCLLGSSGSGKSTVASLHQSPRAN